jgi:protein-tyrosine phosphatase
VVLVALVVIGNIGILGASWWARQTTPRLSVTSLPGVDNLEMVDGRLWRGAAPTPDGYRELAASGVRVVVDLRAEEGVRADHALARSHGLQVVSLPVRDGQVPGSDQIQQFLRVMDESDGLVFVHCGAGVGRTGAMAGAYLVDEGQLNGRGAVRRNLAVGFPSLEQVTFVAQLDEGDPIRRPPSLVTALSRVLDAPRRIAHNLGF